MTNGKKSAKKFTALLERGIMKRNTLRNIPNHDNYDLSQRQRDLAQYKKFLQSFAYDDVKDCKIQNYNGD